MRCCPSRAPTSRKTSLSLATAGIASVTLHVTGKASHAGSAPELGVNALYELSHQILQMRDLSDPATGLKMNWTISKSGSNRNVIPASATAGADVRVLKVSDYDRIEQQVNERVKKQLIPEAKVEMNFERRRPPLEATDASRAMARHAQQIYKDELGLPLGADDKAAGGGTDAAFRGTEDQGARHRALRPAGLRRALGRCRVRAGQPPSNRGCTRHPHGHGHRTRQDRFGQLTRRSRCAFATSRSSTRSCSLEA